MQTAQIENSAFERVVRRGAEFREGLQALVVSALLLVAAVAVVDVDRANAAPGGVGGGGDYANGSPLVIAPSGPTEDVFNEEGQAVGSQASSEFNSLITAFGGWSQMYNGYLRSPIVMDPRVPEQLMKRRYPEIGMCKRGTLFGGKQVCGKAGQRPELYKLELGTDDEIVKSAMPAFQPMDLLQQDFSNSKPLMHNHIDLYGSLRGAAELTLSYIDKTVASALASTQQQVSQDVTNHLLKQILWTTSRLANPSRSELYVDMDEKVERCLADFPKGKASKLSGDGGQCKQYCGEKPTKFGGGKLPGDRKAQGLGKEPQEAAGAYSWCVCCAEVSLAANKSVGGNKVSKTHFCKNEDAEKKGSSGGGDPECWSLVERTFYGTKTFTSGGGSDTDILEAVISNVREIYGDVVFRKGPGKKELYGKHVKLDNGGNGSQKIEAEYVTEFIHPAWSVANHVLAFRDGCENCEGDKCPANKRLACPLTGMYVEYGIHKCMQYLLDEWDTIKEQFAKGQKFGKDSKVHKCFVESSLGYIITAQDIENVRWLDGQPVPKGAGNDGWKLDKAPKAQRWLDSFADSSAIAAVKRLHTRLKAIILDHLTMNQKATAEDKARLLALVGRVDQYFALAEQDAAAGSASALMLTGIGIQTDRSRQALLASVSAANQAHIAMIQALAGSNSMFGTNTRFTDEGGGKGGGS